MNDFGCFAFLWCNFYGIKYGPRSGLVSSSFLALSVLYWTVYILADHGFANRKNLLSGGQVHVIGAGSVGLLLTALLQSVYSTVMNATYTNSGFVYICAPRWLSTIKTSSSLWMTRSGYWSCFISISANIYNQSSWLLYINTITTRKINVAMC